ncbi:MAG: metallopeptidase family protein [Chloroflexi bacterium]|nr:metallopeptidase family protein [Chloroflexota bacterium]
MDEKSFQQLVAQAIDALPREFRDKLENIAVVVEDRPTRSQLAKARLRRGESLLGLYEGVPLTKRHSHYGLVLPDKITIFQKSVEFLCGDGSDIAAAIQQVLQHEIAHHFGIDDARLKQLGR